MSERGVSSATPAHCSDCFFISWATSWDRLSFGSCKRGDSPEIDAYGKESLNFQISMLIYDVIAAILCIVLIGFPILIALWVLNTVLVIIASVKASQGEFYRYPFTIRLIN